MYKNAKSVGRERDILKIKYVVGLRDCCCIWQVCINFAARERDFALDTRMMIA